jgi:outer membrane cobalamin receptor
MKNSPFLHLIISCAFPSINLAAAQTEKPQDSGNEIIVTGTPPAVVQGDGKTVYNLGGNLQATSGSVADVLATLPSVSVDGSGGVRVRGDSTEILVDGKPSSALKGASLAAALQSMAAGTIAKIEVITAPGPEFRINAATIINIITKRSAGAAAKGEIVTNLGAPNTRRNATISGSFGAGKWTFNGNASLRQDLRNDVLTSVLLTRDQNGLDVSRRTERRQTLVPFTNATASVSADYEISPRFTVRVAAEGALRQRPREFVADNSVTDLIGGSSIFSITNDKADQKYNYYSFSGSFFAKNVLGNDKLSTLVTFDDRPTTRNSSDITRFINQNLSEFRIDQRRSERDNIRRGSIDYEVALPKGQNLKLGYELENEIDKTTYSTIINGTNVFGEKLSIVEKELNAAYFEFRQEIGKWTLKGGLRYENLKQTIQQSSITPLIAINDNQWSPSFSLSGDLTTNSNLTALYTRRIERASTDQLAPIQIVVNSITNVGNPNLKSGVSDRFELDYKKQFNRLDLNLGFYFNKSIDEIVEYYFQSSVGQSNLTYSYENAGNRIKIGTNISLNVRLPPKWVLNLNVDAFYERSTTSLVSQVYRDRILTYSAKLDLTWKLNPADTFQFQFQSYGNTLIAGGRKLGYNSANLSYNHKLSPRLKANINVNNIFNSTRYVELTDISQFRLRSDLNVPGIIIYAGLTYKFGAS